MYFISKIQVLLKCILTSTVCYQQCTIKEQKLLLLLLLIFFLFRISLYAIISRVFITTILHVNRCFSIIYFASRLHLLTAVDRLLRVTGD